MTPVFREIAGGVCVLSTRHGYFMQCPLYELNGFVFAKIGARFVKLYANGGTTNLAFRVECIDLGVEPHHKDAMGRLVLGEDPATFRKIPSKRKAELVT